MSVVLNIMKIRAMYGIETKCVEGSLLYGMVRGRPTLIK